MVGRAILKALEVPCVMVVTVGRERARGCADILLGRPCDLPLAS